MRIMNFLAGVGAVVGTVLAIVCGIRGLNHASEVSGCRDFSQASGYETKFVDNSFFTYGCRIKTNAGTWIPVGQP